MSTIINTTDVTVRYYDRAILDAATLAIDEGQRIGLVGATAAANTVQEQLVQEQVAVEPKTRHCLAGSVDHELSRHHHH